MNKNIVIAIGFLLVAVIGYQAYLLKQKSDSPEVKQPEITLNIEKKSVEEKVKELNNPSNESQMQNNLNADEMFDEELIKKDLNKLFADIFGNPKLQEGIKEGMEQMRKGLQEGLQEMQQNLGNLTTEFDKLAQNDPFFKELFQGTVHANRLQFTDRGDDYYLKLDIPGGDESKIDITTKGNLLSLTISQKIIQETQNQNSTIKQESLKQHQNVILIPDDAFIDHLKTDYKEGVLEITLPKVKKVQS